MLKCTITCLKLVLIKILMTFLKHVIIYQKPENFLSCPLTPAVQYAWSKIQCTVANSSTVFTFTLFFPKSRFSGDQIVHNHQWKSVPSSWHVSEKIWKEETEKYIPELSSGNSKIWMSKFIAVTDFKSYCIIIAI